MPTLEELLNDAAGIPDDLELDFGGKGKVKLSDLRSAWKKPSEERSAVERERQKLAEGQKAIAERLAALDAQQKEIERIAAQAAELEAGITAAEKNKGANYEDDPLFGPFVKTQLSPMRESLQAMKATMESLGKTIESSARFVLSDYYDRRWQAVPETERPKDKSWRDYLPAAQKMNLLNEFGMPDPVAALMRETAPNREEALKKAARDEGIRQGREQAMTEMRHIPRPGAQTQIGRTEKAGKNFGSVDEMVDAAFADADILKLMETAPGA